MICTYCGAQNPDPASYCQACGKQMKRAYEGQAVFMAPSSQPLVSASFVNTLKRRENRAYVLAAIGALGALFAFFFLPYSTYRFDPSPYDIYALDSYNGSSSSVSFGGQSIWLDALLAVLALIVVAVLLFRTTSSDTMKRLSAKQIQQGIYIIIGAGVLSILILLLITLIVNVQLQEFTGNLAYSFGVGYWLYLLGMAIVTVSGVLALRTLPSSRPPQAQR